MTTRAVASLALKLIAVFYLIHAAAGIATGSTITYYASSLGWTWVIAAFIVVPALFCLALCWLIKHTDYCAAKLIPVDSLLAGSQASLQVIQRVAFACIGLNFVVYSAPEFVRELVYYILIPKIKYGEIFFGTHGWNASAVLGLLVQIVAGAFLFLQGDGLVALWRQLKKLRGLSQT